MLYHLEVPLNGIDFVQNITGSGSIDVSKSFLKCICVCQLGIVKKTLAAISQK